jgi:Spy/CpxP family protein refolding chaperone
MISIGCRISETSIMASSALLVSVATVSAFAHGPGWGRGGGWGHHGPGWHDRWDCGYRYDDQISKEKYKQFEQKKEAFFKETQELRDNLI